MKQAGYSKRSFSRPPERARQPHTKHSNGSSAESKMRGNPQQCVEKYLNLARDATSLGDPISAENYYQFADHYFRLVAATRPSRVSHSEKKIEESDPKEGAPHIPTQSENWLE
jgi:hypothetical protein